MRTVGVETLKSRLSEYVRSAAAGETVQVTEHDRVVAELGPPRTRRMEVEVHGGTKLADAISQGLITPPRVVSSNPPPRRPVASFERVMSWLDE